MKIPKIALRQGGFSQIGISTIRLTLVKFYDYISKVNFCRKESAIIEKELVKDNVNLEVKTAACCSSIEEKAAKLICDYAKEVARILKFEDHGRSTQIIESMESGLQEIKSSNSKMIADTIAPRSHLDCLK